jgi:leucyl aminopeptidase
MGKKTNKYNNISSMEKMFLDKSGACNVLAVFRGAVEMELKINLTVTIGLAENAIGN